MSSKQILVAVTLFALIGGAAIYLISGRDRETQKPTNSPALTPTATPVKMLTWTDEAGFSFQYPEGTGIDNHPEDKKNYANLTLTLNSKETVQIIMADNTYKNLGDWVGENSALDTTLDSCPAKKILKDDLETIACIDNDVLVTITGRDIAGIVKSWVFIYPSPAPAAKSATINNNDGDVLEEE
ncbi:TPA: hypothetical protein DIU27_03705 [Candidatus Collierbacteria bacterium]|uniref:Uncharacterized protein n=1 Tax=Candidatus Collierbacteria bacterium GW2011_GWB2_44_22 TaxID=1618387 RepID=A0A0G1HYR1_9BACT|nr:MAG: hypothetical protein UW31_C0007G0065 [Candidatus Collierbacteria bacterium GW2011_GWA2_44_13]KKT50461.1 MAG: hypothetical protein UW42_C0018G0001 [Candidatus Collierbacteria bacterium GW2011_GWB1_44_197]KKT52296.1 MAG: hypothetical protein UW44_C0003G0139 [Candidatus Collierbacteria bacterium GW2011_GWB2_44_22]KKT63216.1 MAG: hypothetical protein UW56_C0001G0053 [Candidatus Collierbacteria bacterium GW2011_GWD1_44_27]KKT88999.1 MAG: hypothetical protein UW88_C0006G0024 [Candidatus Colli